jgi:hypothetical protein
MQHSTFAVPAVQTRHVINHPLSPEGLNPYVINPQHFTDVNLNSINTTHGMYHPSPSIFGEVKGNYNLKT